MNISVIGFIPIIILSFYFLGYGEDYCKKVDYIDTGFNFSTLFRRLFSITLVTLCLFIVFGGLLWGMSGF